MNMQTHTGGAQAASPYLFHGGFPTQETVETAYDDADLDRAIQAYRFFYPTVSGAAILKGNADIGVLPNKVFGILDTKPRHVGFTLNSDTPYAPILLDLSVGPFVIELPPGPLIVVAMDVNQRWVADMGVPGPDAGNGGKHLLLPPDYEGAVPEGYHVWHTTTNRLIVGVRSLPVGGDLQAAFDRIKTIKVHPLNPTAGWTDPQWPDLTPMPQDTTPLKWEGRFQYWEVLHDVIEHEPAFEGYRSYYGELAALGIAKGKPFNPDARMRGILERAAQIGHAQMCAQSFANRRPDRVVWADRKWEWVGLRPENGDFDATSYVDVDAREVWFYQAIGASPAMFRRSAGAGSLYWLGLRDASGAYLDGGNTYRLSVPLPVPAQLFWSVTVYDAETRSQIQTDQDKAALRSMFELKDVSGSAAELYFGPAAPAGKEGQWIKTVPGKGWFVYFRIYGPQQPAFDGSWKPGDFEKVK
ncbi:DUF1254 domain-containing protein [Noviherbaspirillum cavernae]|uniref:DUF1254 domain-containing protein n=1 Tax=Noviherbaspirillum cavernae TaxID=2320862 RepID=A0A418WZP4_9BURK|nr:DUF1254 domain-containing protein [Noviherbaspirillum cavernae]RJG05727.1 DUF1254 domain-containing protein [Noviherbaspirillum cavernae]